MKPCTCNGTNDNCRYCSGSGYVSDSTPLPKSPPSRWAPMALNEKEPAPRVFVGEPTNWTEVIVGVLTFSPLIIWFLVWLWKHL